MNLLTLFDMAATAMPDRVALGPKSSGITYASLLAAVRGGAGALRARGVDEVVYLGTNGPALPVALLAAAWAGIPFVPLNYRLSEEKRDALLTRHPKALVIVDGEPIDNAMGLNETPLWSDDPDAVAVLL
ncbi:MAG TPA: AMP-binding protein, partial [Pseudonocardiaceae bacterium]